MVARDDEHRPSLRRRPTGKCKQLRIFLPHLGNVHFEAIFANPGNGRPAHLPRYLEAALHSLALSIA